MKTHSESEECLRREGNCVPFTPQGQRADAIIQDILQNHLPRVIEGLRVGYVDENQILVIYDHAVRARILREAEAAGQGAQPFAAGGTPE